MLRVNLGALVDGAIEVDATVPADDSRFEGLDFRLIGPVEVTGRLSEAGDGDYYLHGRLAALVESTCRRCLEPVSVGAEAELDALFTADDDTEDPSVYQLSARAGDIDLSEMVREELILAVPAFVLCRADCRGLCPRCGTDLNAGTCDCRPEGDPRWEALQELKRSLTDG
jgi:uncharacterized protein